MTQLARLFALLGLPVLAAAALAGPGKGRPQRVIPIGPGTTCVCYEWLRPDSVIESYRAQLNIKPDWCAGHDADSGVIVARWLRTTTWFGGASSDEIGRIADTVFVDTIRCVGGVCK